MKEICPSTTTVATPRRLASLALAAALCLPFALPARAEVLNEIVLRINDKIATLYEYRVRHDAAMLEIRNMNVGPEERQRLVENLPTLVFKDLFEELLVLSRAEQLGLRVSTREADQMIQALCQERDIDTEEECSSALARSGITREEMRARMTTQALIRQVMGAEVYSRIQLEEDDLRLFYRDNPDLFQVPERRKLREVVVLDSSELDAEARMELAGQLRDRIRAGESMEEVISGTSAAGLTSDVIDLDWVPAGDLDESLEQAVSGLQANEVSEPVDGRGGLHLVQLVERQEAAVAPFDQVKDEIASREQQRLFAIELPKYILELEAKSHVISKPPTEAAGFRDTYSLPQGEDPLDAFRRPQLQDTGSAGGQ